MKVLRMHELVLLGMTAFTALIFCLYVYDAVQDFSDNNISYPLLSISIPGFTLKFILLPVILTFGVLITANLVPNYTILSIVVSVFIFSMIRYSNYSLGEDEFERGKVKRNFSIWRADFRPTRIARLALAVLIVVLGIVWIFLSQNRNDASSIFLCAISPPLMIIMIASRYQDLLNTFRFFLGDEREE